MLMPAMEEAARSPSQCCRSVKKRVVSLAVAVADGRTPEDCWAWRKYGQKPIKGSPHPRGYYRCSSSRECPARKQVERSRTDPIRFIVTYFADHNHPSKSKPERARKPAKPDEPSPSPLRSIPAGLRWPSDSPSSDGGSLCGPPFGRARLSYGGEEEDGLFAGLGELPEGSVCFFDGEDSCSSNGGLKMNLTMLE